MRTLPPFALCALLVGAPAVCAQTIPPSEMAGRERYRFMESPAERFMKPGPYLTPNVIDAPQDKPRRGAKHPRKKR